MIIVDRDRVVFDGQLHDDIEIEFFRFSDLCTFVKAPDKLGLLEKILEKFVLLFHRVQHVLEYLMKKKKTKKQKKIIN